MLGLAAGSAMHVLLVKTSSLGDIVHTLPAVDDAVRRGVRFDWVVEEAFEPLPTLVPGVEAVLTVAFRRWRRRPMNALAEIAAVGRRLRQRRYDLVLDAQGLLKSAFVGRLARARERVGYDFASIRERPAALAYDRRLAVPRRAHAIARTRELVARACGYPVPTGAPRFGLTPQRGVATTVLLAHGTTWATKTWPEPYWIELARHVAAAGLTPLVPWADGEQRRAARIANAVPGARLCPPMDLSGLLAVVSGVRGVVGVDSGIAHLAAAFGKPTVMLFGPTDSRLTGCFGARAKNLETTLGCAPCRSRRCHYQGAAPTWEGEPVGPACLALLPPARAWDALQRLMSSTSLDGVAPPAT